MKKLKIGYFADGPWSHKAFEKIITDPEISIEFIVPRSDTEDNKLLEFSKVYNIPYFKLKNVNSEESLNIIRKYDCDLLVSMSFNQIFKEEIINISKNGIINCHAGKLPFYRGRNILNWAIINDEKEFGITVHYVDQGIDTGDIILQRDFPITDNDDYASLLEIAFVECANILYDSLKLFTSNESVKRINQHTIHPIGMYCGRRGIGDEIINWNQSSREVFNFIRSICHPGPKAITYLNEDQVKINSSKFIQNAPTYIGKPGQVLTKTKNGFFVKTRDSFIEIMEVESNSNIKIGEVFKYEK